MTYEALGCMGFVMPASKTNYNLLNIIGLSGFSKIYSPNNSVPNQIQLVKAG
jgi:hypothetical protein